MKEDQFALLKVIEATMVSIKEDVKEIKDSLKTKVEHSDFKDLKDKVQDIEKKNDALHNKWWFASGMATAASYIFSHLIK